MIIKTKFNIGDTVFLIYFNMVIEARICDILASADYQTVRVKYKLIYTNNEQSSVGNQYEFKEEVLFKTKKQLLKTL